MNKKEGAKLVGGFGIRRTQNVNVAEMTKLGWKLSTEDKNIWVGSVKSRYLKNGDSLEQNNKLSSSMWKHTLDQRSYYVNESDRWMESVSKLDFG